MNKNLRPAAAAPAAYEPVQKHKVTPSILGWLNYYINCYCIYWWLSASLQLLQSVSNGVTAVLHLAINRKIPVLSSLCLLGVRPMRPAVGMLLIITLRLRQHGRHFVDDIFKCIFMNENVWFPIKISLKFVPKGLINYIPALVQIMAWRRPGDKPLSEPMMVRSPPHICVARPQWVIQSLFLLSSKLLQITLCCSAELWALWGLTTWQGGGISPGVNWIYKPSSSHLTQ